jgi:SNW domain-containing protein 1
MEGEDLRRDSRRHGGGHEDYGREEDRGRGAHAGDRNELEGREEREERRKRDEIRDERRRERERERRLEAKDAKGFKRSKLTRDRDRDISEKMALGQANVGRTGGEAMYDARLFNQEGGTASGLAGEDQYNLYDKPLFADRGSGLYKASGRGGADDDADIDTTRFKPDKGFKGADVSAGPRSKPVEFERDANEQDPFGLGTLVSDVKGRKRDR